MWLGVCHIVVFPSNLDVCDCACNGWCTAVGEPENAMKHRKALLSEEELLVRDKVRKASKRASETCAQARTEPNTYDKHKHLSSSLRRGFCTSVLFIDWVLILFHSGKPQEKCPLCEACYMPEFKGSVCRVCQVSAQLISVISLYNWLLNFYVLMYICGSPGWKLNIIPLHI